jgi:hypothetical protein
MPASKSLKVFYCLVLLSWVIPDQSTLVLLKSIWMSKGMLSRLNIGVIVGMGIQILFYLGIIYRIYYVIRKPAALDSYIVSGASNLFRTVSIPLIYLGGFLAVVSKLLPLLVGLISVKTDSGAEIFVFKIYLFMALGVIGGLAILGVLFFELSRYLAQRIHIKKLTDSRV